MRRITKSFADKVTEQGFYRADDTLYLYVRDTGRKSWVQRITVEGRRHNLGLGSYPLVTIDDAKLAALENRRKLYRGISPVAEKKAATMPTFDDAAVKYRETQTWAAQTAKTFAQTVAKYLSPVFSNVPVDQIEQTDVLDVLVPIFQTAPSQGKRTRKAIRGVLDYCLARQYVNVNVAGPAINAGIPKAKTNGNNYRSMPYQDMPGAVRSIETGVKSLSSRLCLLFTIYTAARIGEARAASWSEIDLDARVWDIPGERMKAGKAHRVPLSDKAIDVLEEAKPLRNVSDLIFPSAQTPLKPMASETLLHGLKAAGLADKTVVHGFRSTFKTWATELSETPREVIESALAHNFGNEVEQAYFRGDLFDKRRALMQAWGDYIKS